MADDKDFRIISRDSPDGSRVIAAVRDSGETDKTDDEILDALSQWKQDQRHLRPVDGEGQ